MNGHIKSTMRRIWENQIWRDYLEDRILSERELQARLFAYLWAELEDIGLRIFVEPTIRGFPTGYRCPDLLVAARSDDSPSCFKAIAIVELKMDRSGQGIKFEEELDRIRAIGHVQSLTIDYQRPDLGEGHFIVDVDPQAMFLLGFIGRGDDPRSSGSTAVYPERIRNNDGGFSATHPDLASRTFLLCGRTHRDGASRFHVESYLPRNEEKA